MRNHKALEILIMNKRGQNDWGLYEPIRPAYLWLKQNFTPVAICLVIGFAFGYSSSESRIEMDCKYAKSVRLNSTAFKCERII